MTIRSAKLSYHPSSRFIFNPSSARNLSTFNQQLNRQSSYHLISSSLKTNNPSLYQLFQTDSSSTMRADQSKITFAGQGNLPNLPVPELQSTASKYLHSILPLVSDQTPGSGTASDSNPTEAYENTKRNVSEFLSSPLVKELQLRLKDCAENQSRENWLSEWWNDLAYMGYRDPLIPFSSYYIAHQVDKSRRNAPLRAASLVRALLYFRDLLVTEQLEPDRNKNGPLCMSSYRYLFNSCRFPEKPSDSAKRFDPLRNNHLIVIRKGRFFEVSTVKPNGDWLSESELESQFRKVIELAGTEETTFPVGALTNEHRDVWADARVELCKTDPLNIKSLERIESSIICVALDSTSPITRDELGYNLWIGDGKNRFFDKQQIIVFENGQSGFMAEHSCMDGTPVSRFNDWILQNLTAKKIDLGNKTVEPSLPDPIPINFNLSEKNKDRISQAIINCKEIMSAQTLDVLQYSKFGKKIIKDNFRASPDAIAQLTFQLGFYKLFGKVPVTYESCQTRKFKLGRTEVIRSCSIEALEWCKAMEDLKSDWKVKLEKFREAEKAHLRYAKWASDGQGVDRHLLGLKLCLKPGEELPNLFKDPIFNQSNHWILSTSTLPSEHFNGLGYGAVVPDGFGLAYAVNEESVRYTIVTTTGNGKKFKQSLEDASDEIFEMMKVNQVFGGAKTSAKL
ncbi:carnitine palmitoyltransferase II [Phakopsora pachyrhizi]|uniref:Carnitine O-acetyltransferase, mitochondrial n=1 Tax=Phakopsora pachyrhizi TaxID=170000 RepID=A0AAV0AFZ2_PHAPC|nr:carnitine palmitoyltransferase II [Phakopsora pachyrhizi]CAH7667076.1 carnitine palmitoyltransferase II [Phakopsora pachyrhizi]